MDIIEAPRSIRGEYSNSIAHSQHLFGLDSLKSDGLIEIASRIWRRRWTIAGIAIVTIIAFTLFLYSLTSRYTARAAVMLEVNTQAPLNEAPSTRIPADAETLQSEVEILRSRVLAEAVVAKLKLDEDPEFNRSLQPQKSLSEMLGLERFNPDWLRRLWLPAAPPKAISPARLHADTVNSVLNELSVAVVGRSRVFTIDFESTDAEKAAAIANAWGDAYVLSQLERKLEITKRANGWLTEHASELREQVEKSEAAVERYRTRSDLLRTGDKDETLLSQEITQLSTQLTVAQSQLEEATAHLRQVEKAQASPQRSQALAQVLQSSLIQTLQAQEAAVAARLAELSSQFGPRLPRVIDTQAELKDIRQKILSEANKIIESMRVDLSAQQSRVASMQGRLGELKEQLNVANAASVQLNGLQREATASRTLYETFLARAKETAAQQNFSQPEASVISSAPVPLTPSFPRKKILLMAASFGALAIATLIALLLEAREVGFRSMDEIERLTGASALGLLPSVPLPNRADALQQHILKHPNSAFCEGLRGLAEKLLATPPLRRPNSVLFTSSIPAEGKTTVAAATASLLAQAGKRVLFIDCDLRRPTGHTVFGLPIGPGVADIIRGDLKDTAIIRREAVCGTDVITAGTDAQECSKLASSDAMRRFLVSVSNSNYDIVIIDSPPVLAVFDATMLARFVDHTVLLARWESTRKQLILRSIKTLRQADVNIAGILVTQVDARKHSRYGFSDSGLYHGDLRKYYGG